MAIAYSPVPFWFSPFYSARQSPEIPFGTTVCRHTISCWLIPPAWLCSLLPSHRCGWDSLHPSQSLDFLWVSQTLKYQAGSRTAPICPQSWASCTASQRGLKVPDLKLDYFSLFEFIPTFIYSPCLFPLSIYILSPKAYLPCLIFRTVFWVQMHIPASCYAFTCLQKPCWDVWAQLCSLSFAAWWGGTNMNRDWLVDLCL